MAKVRSFNQNHPELQEGEVFVCNISLGESLMSKLDLHNRRENGDYRSDWECIEWKTKRMGEVAYYIYGIPI